MAEQREGGCACGAVRYRLAGEPFDTGWCHCRTCQRVSGAPAMAFSSVKAEDFRFVQGEDEVRSFASSEFGRREYCGRCGSPLTIRVDFQPETVDFPVATLDEPDAVAPGFHIFRASKLAWFETADALPRHERFRPETRGLEGTEPPH
ncbi:MAG: GFA family protein [Sphingomonadaceae bacterium]|nr:GFA family protein [Sphingomonadaceae bacterium]